MAKLTAAQRKVLSMKKAASPYGKARPRPAAGGYPGMGAGMNPAKMMPLSSMGRC